MYKINGLNSWSNPRTQLSNLSFSLGLQKPFQFIGPVNERLGILKEFFIPIIPLFSFLLYPISPLNAISTRRGFMYEFVCFVSLP